MPCPRVRIRRGSTSNNFIDGYKAHKSQNHAYMYRVGSPNKIEILISFIQYKLRMLPAKIQTLISLLLVQTQNVLPAKIEILISLLVQTQNVACKN